MDKYLKIAEENLEAYKDRYTLVKYSSSEAAAGFDDDTFDFVLIDGDHSYEATLADCEAYYPFLKKGGFFCGHDYSSIDAVYRAVNDFREKNKISSPINLSTNSTFFWYK